MAISTNSIIHYTNSFSNLKSILKDGFKVKYCVEKLNLLETTSNAAHPMVSFCDIPLSDSQQHFAAYGKFGIGLSKKWAIEHGINPVIYIDENSLFSQSMGNLIKERRDKSSSLPDEIKSEILRLKSYAKNYSGPLKRKGVNNEDYKFYDEREWRLVPGKSLLGKATFSVASSFYKKDKEKYNNKLSDIRITFGVSDISYIIVKDTNQIPKMINFLRSTYSNRYTADDLDILFSKICSTEQITQDF